MVVKDDDVGDDKDRKKVLSDWEALRWLHRGLETGTEKPLTDREYKILKALFDAGYPQWGSLKIAREALIQRKDIWKNTKDDSFEKKRKTPVEEPHQRVSPV